MDRLGDVEPQVRASAAWSLASVDGGDAAQSALRAALRDPDPEVRRAAKGALRRAGPGPGSPP
jgi:HEAT repeat protein